MLKSMGCLLAFALILGAGSAVSGDLGPGSGEWSLVALGDCMPGLVYEDELAKGLNPFRNIAPFIKGADVAVANLEGPLTSRGTRVRGKQFIFRCDPARAAMLRESGIGVVGLANNHILDYGPVGLSDTIGALSGAGVSWCGAGDNLESARRPAFKVVRGVRVAFLSYNRTLPASYWAGLRRPGTAFADPAYIREDVAKARAGNDRVIILVHWGREKSYSLRDYQRVVSRAASEAGADLVIGTHPHIPQGVEVIGRTVVVHSIGDGVFGGSPRRNVASLVLRATFGEQGLRRVELFPFETSNEGTGNAPKIQEGESARKTLELVKGLSEELGTRLSNAVSPEGFPSLTLEMPPPGDGKKD